MSARTLKHALSRPGFWFTVLIGGVLAATVTPLWGGVVVGVGVLSMLRVTFKSGLHQKLLFEDDKRGRGIKRKLKATERRALDEIAAYCQELRENAFDSDLAGETWDKAWELVRNATGQDGTKELQQFVLSLPPLEEADSGPGLQDKIQKDLEHRRKIDRELDLL